MANMVETVVEPDVASRVGVGVAGWSYADWKGCVYPASERDTLRFVAEYVDLIEIDTTFYRVPPRKMVQSWCDRTADLANFRFTAKLNRQVTHESGFDGAHARDFLETMRPLADNGRLAHLLAQFRWDFRDSAEARERLVRIRDAFGGGTPNLTLELRHASWQEGEALAFLDGLRVTVANLDYPVARDSFNLPLCTVGRDAYLRLHGRNAKAWFDKKAGRDETYNYCYNDLELDDIAARAVALARMTRSLTVVANNHYQGKEVLNALELKNRITGRPVKAPPDLVRTYPRLARIAALPPERSTPRQGELKLV